MTILNLVGPDSKLLRDPSERFNFIEPQYNPIELYENLSETMIKHKGIGLSAVQVGLPYRVFVISSDPVMGLFNPSIIDEGEEEIMMEEGCLTYPGLYFKVKRPKRIRVRYFEANGEVKTESYMDLSARVIQHEMMHLEGILFPEMSSRLQLEMAMKRAKKYGYTYTIRDLL